ncbi:hypothetical protein EMCRGX_G008633 [Ephydatia muelleri]
MQTIHLLSPYMDDGEKEVWFKLSKVFRIAYCQPFDPEMVGSYESDCSSCVTAILANLKRKLKVHLLLHLSNTSPQTLVLKRVYGTSVRAFQTSLVLNLWNCKNLMLCRNIWENMWNQRSVFANREPCASYQQQPWNLVPLRWPSQNVVPSFYCQLDTTPKSKTEDQQLHQQIGFFNISAMLTDRLTASCRRKPYCRGLRTLTATQSGEINKVKARAHSPPNRTCLKHMATAISFKREKAYFATVVV